MKAEGSWTNTDARKAMVALWRSGFVNRVKVLGNNVYFDPIDGTQKTLENINDALKQHGGRIAEPRRT